MTKTKPRILVVDDEESIREIVSRKMQQCGYECWSAPSADIALELIDDLPFELLIVDILMPGASGIEILRYVQGSYPETAVVLVTAVNDTHTAVEAMKMGAYDYVTKPFNLDALAMTVNRALEKRRLLEENRGYRLHLEDKVREQAEQIERSYNSAIEALVAALDIRDAGTEGHCRRVVDYTLLLAKAMGIEEKSSMWNAIEYGALLHDIGKIGLPDDILRKPGPLNEAEWERVKLHPEQGYRVLQGIPFLRNAAEVVYSHHERFDGTGYPSGLAGDAIPLGARIFAVADAFDAITSARPYRPARPLEDAVEEIERSRGSHFDPKVVEAFLTILPELTANPVEAA
ncbi:MAG: response regulator [Chloroflexi bacterium]|nr:response regulator [Chloroflexota bacterium]